MRPLVVTTGEPAGIGPDICLLLARREQSTPFCLIGDPDLLEDRAKRRGLPVSLIPRSDIAEVAAHAPGTLQVLPESLRSTSIPGELNAENSPYVVALIERAARLCASGDASAMVTAPVQKSVIKEAGFDFSGHTEFLAALVGGDPLMLLAGKRVRVALVTTHLPLQQVPKAISESSVGSAIRRLDAGLRRMFRLPRPRILVLGLNPHAGESGYLGREEIDAIEPAIAFARQEGFDVEGPVAADTAFAPDSIAGFDAVLAMYHDQGLTPIKALEFGEVVNVTLGLPIIRTSVDHGTALPLAGTLSGNPDSLLAAVDLAAQIVAK